MHPGIFVIKIDTKTLANWPGKDICEILDWVKDQIVINKTLRNKKIMWHGQEIGSFDIVEA